MKVVKKAVYLELQKVAKWVHMMVVLTADWMVLPMVDMMAFGREKKWAASKVQLMVERTAASKVQMKVGKMAVSLVALMAE